MDGKLSNCINQDLFHRTQGASGSKGDTWEHVQNNSHPSIALRKLSYAASVKPKQG
jgi:hypothetical protein